MAKSFKGKVVKGKYWDLYDKVSKRLNSGNKKADVVEIRNELYENLFSGKFKLDLKK